MVEPVQVGKYQLLDRIGTGGMAEVHLARVVGAAGFEKLVVVKRLLPALAEESDYVAQFIDEARLAATFSHANIVSTFDFGEADGSYFIAMEYVEGKNLRRIQDVLARRGKAIEEHVAIHLVSELCRGLEYAHTRKDQGGNLLNVVHRDVSPQNVVVSYSGDVKVLDFGIAKSSSREFKTAAGIVKGKLRYMAPEQVANEPIDGRADLFAAGVILWELLFGKRPMPDMPDTELVEWVRMGEFTRPAGAPPTRPELDEILRRALAVDLGQRFPSCGEFARALSRYNSQYSPDFTPGDLARLLEVEFAEDMKRERSWINGILGGFSAQAEANANGTFAVGVVPASLAENQASLSPSRAADQRAEAPTLATPSRGFVSKQTPSAELPLVKGAVGTASVSVEISDSQQPPRNIKGKSGLAQAPVTEVRAVTAPGDPAIEIGGHGRRKSRVGLWILGIVGLVATSGIGLGVSGVIPIGMGTKTPARVSPTPMVIPSPSAAVSAVVIATETPTQLIVATPTATPTAVVIATRATTPRRTPTPTPPPATPTPTATQAVYAGPPAKISVAVEQPGWGEVWIDGRRVKSETPLMNFAIAPGTHDIWVVRDGKKSVRRIILRPGEKQTYVLPMPR